MIESQSGREWVIKVTGLHIGVFLSAVTGIELELSDQSLAARRIWLVAPAGFSNCTRV